MLLLCHAPLYNSLYHLFSTNSIKVIPLLHSYPTIYSLKVKVKVAHSCPTLCDPMDYTVHGILQGRILEWVAFAFSWGSSQPRDWTQVSQIAGGFFTSWATGEVHLLFVLIICDVQHIFMGYVLNSVIEIYCGNILPSCRVGQNLATQQLPGSWWILNAQQHSSSWLLRVTRWQHYFMSHSSFFPPVISFYFLLKYSWFLTLCLFQVYTNSIQLY